MQSLPPDPDALDSDWDQAEGGEEDPDSTRLVDSRELFARAGFKMDETGEAVPDDQGEPAGAADGRITLPPPVPENEYVARMMQARTSSSQDIPTMPRSTIPWQSPRVADDFEGTLGVLLEEHQGGLDCDEPGVVSSPPLLDFGSPSIEAAEISVDELSEELSLEPPRLPHHGELASLDDLDIPQPGPMPRVRGTFKATERPGGKPVERSGRTGTVRPGGKPVERSSGTGTERPGAEADDRPSHRSGETSGIDFRLDLGFDVPDLSEEAPPATPPPGTLRYGLLEEDPELDVFGAAAGTPEAPPMPARREVLRTLPSPPLATEHPRPADTPSSAGDRHRKLKQRFEAGDYSGAMVVADALLEEDADDEIARRYADSCNEMLRQMYKARIGDGSQVLRVVISAEEVRSLSLDHRAGFLLSCIDGYSSIDEILDVSGMQPLEALRILYELIQADVIRCDPAR